MPDDQNTTQNPVSEGNSIPPSPQEPTEPAPETTTHPEPSTMPSEAPENPRNSDNAVPVNNDNPAQNEPEAIRPKTAQNPENQASSAPEPRTAQTPVNEPFPLLVGERILLSPVRCLGSCSFQSHPAEPDRAHPTRPHKPLSGFSCPCLVCRFRYRFIIAYHTGTRL